MISKDYFNASVDSSWWIGLLDDSFCNRIQIPQYWFVVLAFWLCRNERLHEPSPWSTILNWYEQPSPQLLWILLVFQSDRGVSCAPRLRQLKKKRNRLSQMKVVFAADFYLISTESDLNSVIVGLIMHLNFFIMRARLLISAPYRCINIPHLNDNNS